MAKQCQLLKMKHKGERKRLKNNDQIIRNVEDNINPTVEEEVGQYREQKNILRKKG